MPTEQTPGEIVGQEAKPILLTAAQLKSIAPSLSQAKASLMADIISDGCVRYGITKKLPFQMFLANLIQESGELAHREENMNYSAARIVAVWPTRFKSVAEAQPYANNPHALSNKVYGGRMGNTEPNDGFEYKGGGPIGITGKETYQKYADYIGKPVKEAAILIRTDDYTSIDSACWFFAILKKLIPVANSDNFKAVCKGINGGLIGYDVRVDYYNKVKKVLG